MLVTVCIPSVRPSTLGAAIESVRGQTYADWELVVVGQGDEAALRKEVAVAADGDERVRYVHDDRLGANAARNRGVDAARGEVIAFTDDDCEAAPDWLQQIVDRFAQGPSIGLVAGSLVRPEPPAGAGRFKVCPETIPLEVVYDPERCSESPEGFGVALANMAIRRTVVERVGPFDELLGPGTRFPAADDTDYVLRIEAAGFVMWSTPAAVVHHTYGYRVGVKAAFRILRSYAIANGALAAKLTLAGDRRGGVWLRRELRLTFVDPFSGRRPQVLPRRLVRLGFYLWGYGRCRRRCRVTTSDDLASATLRYS